MAYAFQVFNDTGDLIYSTDSVTWMQIDSFAVLANEIVEVDYPELSGWTIKVYMDLLDQPPDAQEHYAPIPSISGTTVTIAPQTGLPSFAARVIVIAKG